MSRVMVVVVGQAGCPACEEYLPRFRARAQRYAGAFPIHVFEADKFPQEADRLQITDTPTTLVLRAPQGQLRWTGAQTNGGIDEILDLAYRHR